jgi:hypothetical protein
LRANQAEAKAEVAVAQIEQLRRVLRIHPGSTVGGSPAAQAAAASSRALAHFQGRSSDSREAG